MLFTILAKDAYRRFRRQKVLFELKFKEILDDLPENVEKTGDLVEKMKDQGPPILDEVLLLLKEHFGEYEVVEAEEDLMEMIEFFQPKRGE